MLIPGTGHFSESWAVQTEALGGKVIRTPWVEGRPIDAAAVEQALRDDTQHEIVAVFAVHTDTASGVTSDLPALRAAIDAAGHPALFVVDVVASLGVVPFDMDALRADVVIGASQKGLMLPPGLGFVAVNDARHGGRPRPTRRRASTGTGAAAAMRCRTASSAARRRSTCCSACRPRCG